MKFLFYLLAVIGSSTLSFGQSLSISELHLLSQITTASRMEYLVNKGFEIEVDKKDSALLDKIGFNKKMGKYNEHVMFQTLLNLRQVNYLFSSSSHFEKLCRVIATSEKWNIIGIREEPVFTISYGNTDINSVIDISSMTISGITYYQISFNNKKGAGD